LAHVRLEVRAQAAQGGIRVSNKQDVEKTWFWQRTIREAARSGLSTREFCLHRASLGRFHACRYP
jgi:hypothetical protein